MAIISTDILYKLSIKTGAAGNSLPQADPDASLGKYISTTEIVDATLNNLWDDITGDENAASDVEYRCFFVHNAHGSLTLTSPVVWLAGEGAGGATIAIAIDDIAASAIGSAPAQADEVADESTPPSGESFTAPTTKGTGLSLGDLQTGYCRAIWVRRTANDTIAVDDDDVTIRVEGDTAA